jgi:mannose-6-phosphate isomerase-like protein (cupin superfamily)
MVHCTLQPGQVSQAVQHRTVEELWLVIGGQGELWRATGDSPGEVIPIGPRTWLTIPLGSRFQFRNTGNLPLEIVIVTIPPWPGANEAVFVGNHWKRS